MPRPRLTGRFLRALALGGSVFPMALFGGEFRLYPEGATSANPRVPCVPPATRSGGGKAMDVEARFRYTFAPFVDLSSGGKLEADVRGTPRRMEQSVLALEAGRTTLIFQIQPASQGRLPILAVKKDGATSASVEWPHKLPDAWTRITLRWGAGEAVLTVGEAGGEVRLPLPEGFVPGTLMVATALVDEVRLEGRGALNLTWQDGYAARLEPQPDTREVTARVLGFDTHVISLDPEKRDCPTVQVLNAGRDPHTVTFSYAMKGEAAAGPSRWTQEITAPPGTSVEVPMTLPEQMPSDIYHLSIRADTLTRPLVEERHFLRIEPRNEPAGTSKFGLHDSDRKVFGFWPDALPISLCHIYAYWGYIVGPAWIKDPGMTPDTPPREWNWNPMMDWAIGQGLTPYVCVQSVPFAEWMRARPYEGMKKYPWGEVGGFPKVDLYRKFLAALVEKYRGQIPRYEVENEPMAHHMPPADYSAILEAAGEVIHFADPQAAVYGICGTGDFVPWMREVFAQTGGRGMDGVAIHTYVTPSLPEAANLPGKLEAVREIIAGSGRDLPILNSETGTYVALREEVDRPLPDKRLAELIEAGNPGLTKRGWPFRAISEHEGAVSVVRNAIYNFLAKAEYYTFFGYNPDWPKDGWFTNSVWDPCWALVSATKDGVRTPSLHTLAAAVLTEQLKGAHQQRSVKLDESGVLGGLFPKENGGEVAVLWSPQGRRSVLVETPGDSLEVVSLFGQSRKLAGASPDGRNVYRIEVGNEPLYLHTPESGLRLLRSPVLAVTQELADGNSARFQFTLVNRSQETWKGNVRFSGPPGWEVTPGVLDFSLPPGQRGTFSGVATIPEDATRGSHELTAGMRLGDGTPFSFPIPIEVKARFAFAKVGPEFPWKQKKAWRDIQPVLRLDRPEQAVIGRPPLMASLQEERYWKGPDELSARVAVASNAEALFIHAVITDANFREPKQWPGVLGSCVEIFLDARSPENGFGTAPYGRGVHQLVLKPTDSGADLWDVTAPAFPLKDALTAGGRLSDGQYWVAVRIPWKALEDRGPAIGFDLGVNGPPPGDSGRKNQLMLFGSASNAIDASGFAVGRPIVGAQDKPKN